MMNATNPSLPPVPSGTEIQFLVSLLAMLADPAKTRKAIADYTAAAKEAREAIDQAAVDRKVVDEYKATQAAALAELDRKQSARLATELEEHQTVLKRERDDADARERKLAEREKVLEAAEARTAALQASLDRKLKVLAAA